MKILLDTCVVIDALQSREPFKDNAEHIIIDIAEHRYRGYITAKSLTDIYYLTCRHLHDKQKTRDVIGRVLALFRIIDTTRSDCKKDFSGARIAVHSPDEFLKSIS